MIAIIAGCGANISSVQFALTRLGKKSVLTTDIKIIKSASHVILPGVGAADSAMSKLNTLKLDSIIRQLEQPVLGICLGMQILYESSAEGNVTCLGIFPGKIAGLLQAPLPHMGWNKLQIKFANCLLFNGIKNESHVYFTHSYAAPVNDCTLASAHYGNEFSAAVQNKNFFGTQFHPERSGEFGQLILENFLKIQ